MTDGGQQRPTGTPEWAEAGKPGFTSEVHPGVNTSHDGLDAWSGQRTVDPSRKRKALRTQEYVDGVRAGDRTLIGRTITLIESNAPDHLDQAQEILQALLPHTGNSIRIGITGVPGAGKSTFIDAFGNMLCEEGHRVAVLAVDPSSTVTRGSILGDKTRMERLTRQANSFIRPSPSGGALGGVSRKSRETQLICEAAGYDVILIETVGVGQSEATVRSMSDFFLLLTLTGAGDELQNIKRGVIENADAVFVNKADGNNRQAARRLQSEFNQALHYLTSPTPGWSPQAFCVSAVTGEGLPEVWNVIRRFQEMTQQSGFFEERRKNQIREWVMSMVQGRLESMFLNDPGVKAQMPSVMEAVDHAELPATSAALKLLQRFEASQGERFQQRTHSPTEPEEEESTS